MRLSRKGEGLSQLWHGYLIIDSDSCGYNFIVDRDKDHVLGFACYGPRDLIDGVFDLYRSPLTQRLSATRSSADH
ncbi:MAG: hypothetical protein IPJ46_13465 [Anaerolineales bacterium]|nr:hypothetical protein [Anaerolineales bacterium]